MLFGRGSLHHGLDQESPSPVKSGLFVAIVKAQAVSQMCQLNGLCWIMLPCSWAGVHWCATIRLCRITLPCLWADAHSCELINLCCITVPCLWAGAHSCELSSWSHDWGFLHDCQWCWAWNILIKNIGQFWTAWYFIEHCMETKANLCLSRIAGDKNWRKPWSIIAKWVWRGEDHAGVTSQSFLPH